MTPRRIKPLAPRPGAPDQAAVRLHDAARVDHALRARVRARASSSTTWRVSSRSASFPVREALRLLQSEGLVLSVAHVGATVAPISRESVVEVFTLLEGLEVVAARVAAERATAADFERSAAFVAEMDRALEAGSPLHWAEINTRFHLAISRLADMPILQDMMQRARRLLGSRAPLLLPRRAHPSHPARAGRAPCDARPDAGARDSRARGRPSASTTAAALAAYMAHLEGVVDPTRSGSVPRERCAIRPRRGAQERRPLQASPRRRPASISASTMRWCRPRVAVRRSRSSTDACASATGSASCRWKDGTARPTASRAT